MAGNEAHRERRTGRLERIAIESERDVKRICQRAIEDVQRIVQRRIDNGREVALAGRGLLSLEKTLTAYYNEMGIKIGRSFRSRLTKEMKEAYDMAKNDIRTRHRRKIQGEPDTKTIDRFMQSTFQHIAQRTDKMSADHIAHLRSVSAQVFRVSALTGKPLRSVVRELRDRAMEIPGFRFTDRGGRVWSNQSYFTMLARTELMNAGRDVYDNTCAENGYDVVRLDYSGGSCEACSKYEGEVFSLTGATPGLPTKQDLIDAGVFHPNCTHSYTALTDYELFEMGIEVRNPGTEDEDLEETKPMGDKDGMED